MRLGQQRKTGKPQAIRAAFALVLFCLALNLILIVGLLTRAKTERSSSSAFSSSTSARQLSEMAINLVQGQITSATTQGAGVT